MYLKIKRLSIGLILIFSNILFAQIPADYLGVISEGKYFENPKKYLFNLDSNKIGTGILLDRVFYSKSVINSDGLANVTTLDYGDFYKTFNDIKYAQNDTLNIPKFDSLLQIGRYLYKTNRINLIPIIDYQFNRILQSNIDNGDFIQKNNYLDDSNATSDSYSLERVVAFSCFKYNIFGSKVKFLVHEDFIFSNQNDLTLSSIEIDFGNGDGFQTVFLNDVVTVNYSGESNYVELKVKLNYFNQINSQNESVYAHSSIYRKDDNGIPLPSTVNEKLMILENSNSKPIISYTDNSSMDEEINPDRIFNYPYFHHTICPVRGVCTTVLIDNTGNIYPLENGTLEISILYSPVNRDNMNNTNKKLRKPFIIVDGFDPGNTRDYYETVRDNPDDLLIKEQDFRGIYEILNGKHSPWDNSSEQQSFLGDKLREDGYDLIFVNFTDGAGDIFKNAQFLRRFLNDIVNGSLRDNKTEEIVMVGPSMGGLITRVALTEMEKNGEEHFVKTWLSFDSPHKGASIPISMQHAVHFSTKLNTIGLENKANKSLKALNSTAAKQLLLHHHNSTTSYAKPDNNHLVLQNYLTENGYPIFSKNYAITNGGKTPLYIGRKQIINYEFNLTGWTYLKGWGNYNSDGFSKIFEGSRQGFFNDKEINVNGQMALENGTGGWIGALYSLNYQKNNRLLLLWGKATEDKIHGQKSNFIPTASAFGIEVTRSNVFLNHEYYTNINDFTSGKIRTPFDGIFGMIENEEHMKISLATKDHVITDWFIPDYENSTRPVLRVGESVHQTVSKPVGYVAKETLDFGGNNNTITFNSTSDVNIVAGETIRFLPGTTIKNGAKLSARIEEIDNNNYILKKSSIKQTSNSRNYLHDSPFTNRTYNYTNLNDLPKKNTSLKINIYPNPVKDILFIEIKEEDSSQPIILQLFDLSGKIVYSTQAQKTKDFQLDITHFSSGIYLLKVSTTNSMAQTKVIKL